MLTPPPASAPRDGELDGFRGIAVLLVVFYHGLEALFPTGKVGVDVFFVLSGYLITGQLCREYRAKASIDKLRFYVKRSARLLPALVLAFAGMCVVGGLAEGIPRLKTLARDAVFVFSYTANIPRALGYQFPDWFGHAWSLAIEWHFYLVWPLVLTWLCARVAGRPLVRTLTLMAAAAWIWMGALVLFGASYHWVYNSTDCRLAGLLTGAALSQCDLFYPRNPANRVRGLVIGASSLAVIIALGLLTFPVTAASTFLLSMLASLASAGVIRYRELLRWVLGTKPVIWIGSISYGLYLWHYPILRLLREKWGAVPAWPIIGMLLALLAAQLSFKFVEVPAQRMFGRKKPPAPPPAAAVSPPPATPRRS